MHVVTIVARNFVPRAVVLARTFREHNPEDDVSVLVVDAEPGEVVPATDDYAVITPDELSLAADEFSRMALIYDVTELSTALKPWALELVLDRGAGSGHLPRPGHRCLRLPPRGREAEPRARHRADAAHRRAHAP